MAEAYTLVDAATVLNACGSYQTKREARVAAIRDEIVDHLVTRRLYWLFSGVPKAKRTRDLVRERLRHGDIWHDYNLCQLSGDGDAAVVRAVQAVARVAYFSTHHTDVKLGSRAALILLDAGCL